MGQTIEVSVTHFKRHYSKLLNGLEMGRYKEILVLRHGKPQGVLKSPDAFGLRDPK